MGDDYNLSCTFKGAPIVAVVTRVTLPVDVTDARSG